jgi:addiction module RelE/StbE family toxin
MRRVVWTTEAIGNLTDIRAYIGSFNPLAAQRFALRLWNAAESLAEHPERGRMIGKGRRELAVVRPYLIRYRIMAEGVEILTIRHGARRPD